MFDTVSVSDLQRSLSKILKSTRGFRYILSNNKKQGLLVSKELMEYLEESGTLEEYEDAQLLKMFEQEYADEKEKLRKGDFSGFVTFDELCQSI